MPKVILICWYNLYFFACYPHWHIYCCNL